MNSYKSNSTKQKDPAGAFTIILFNLIEWFGEKFDFGDSYFYHNADIYVSASGARTSTNLQSSLQNIRQHCKTKKWQIKEVDKVTGVHRWEDLSQAEVEGIIDPALAAHQTPTFNFHRPAG